MKADKTILRVAVPTPLRRLFDYLPARYIDESRLLPGMRVAVPFGKKKEMIGLIMEIATGSDYPYSKLKPINRLVDAEPVIDRQQLKLINWASRYYHHPPGEVFFNAVPAWVRQGQTLEKLQEFAWKLTDMGRRLDTAELKRAPRQQEIIKHLGRHELPVTDTALLAAFPGIRPVLDKLVEKELVEQVVATDTRQTRTLADDTKKLNTEQREATARIINAIGQHQVFVLDGLTGSGKTEVYMAAITAALEQGLQSLVLLPEIGLTPQIIRRFQERFDCHIAVQHSGLSDRERARDWLAAKQNRARIILGTRSAVWTPLAKPGLFIADEEHDLSYKQQDGFRYSAKDIMMVRSQQEQVPVVLGSATPSLESLCNIERKKHERLVLSARAGDAKLPEYKLIDIRGKKMHGPLSQVLVDEMRRHLAAKNQVLLFLNRRGYANNLYCHTCGWKASCERCELPFTYHKSSNKLVCHHCEKQQRSMTACPGCHAELILVGHGTERIEEVLEEQFPDQRIARIDRDTTRKKHAMTDLLELIRKRNIDILIGTQMLAKGHHFPGVTLTAIVDADRGLFSTDFRASERLAQLFMQVSGRSGRGDKPGTVLVQTHNPEHTLFQQLISNGYARYAQTLLQERQQAWLPPYTYMVLLNAEAHNADDCRRFLNKAVDELKRISGMSLSVFGPLPALFEKRSGRYRWQLIVQAEERKQLHSHIDEWLVQLEAMKLSKKIRWSLDVDPMDMT